MRRYATRWQRCRVPGADALAGAQIIDDGNCLRVEGWPVRLVAP
jgi:hypothetical protein